MIGFGQPERHPPFAREPAQDELFLLSGSAKMLEHRDEREVADNRMLVLQIVVQAQPHGRKPVADYRHPQVRSVPAAVLFGRGKAPVPRFVGARRSFAQQHFPFAAR